ncbi:MAG: hypothetical protein L3J66_01075 [Bacteroidales bacterium]|nr:hypothetical protein [Bacteroidales bacterium]
MKKYFNITLLIIFSVAVFSSCSRISSRNFSFAFYNVENLFDTINDPDIRDGRYVPGSDLQWDTEKYLHKLNNLARVMAVVDSTGFPSVFGLSEVENLAVVRDLIKRKELKKAGYKILHKDSPDGRGIDVALLYRPKIYKPLETYFIRPVFPTDPENKTRDILYSKGLVGEKDTIHIFVNHWVSRWGGQEKTEPHRIALGQLLKQTADSIFELNPNANILIAGDLNDNPTDKSIAVYLKAVLPVADTKPQTLYNLSLAPFQKGEGSLYYKSWDMFDQIIVSTALLKGSEGLKTTSDRQTVIKKDWMLYQPEKGPERPSRTAAKNYYGGYSDHLPVFISMHVLK